MAHGPLVCSLSFGDILISLVSKLGTLQFIQNLFKIEQEVKCSKDDRCQPTPDCNKFRSPGWLRWPERLSWRFSSSTCKSCSMICQIKESDSAVSCKWCLFVRIYNHKLKQKFIYATLHFFKSNLHFMSQNVFARIIVRFHAYWINNTFHDNTF